MKNSTRLVDVVKIGLLAGFLFIFGAIKAQTTLYYVEQTGYYNAQFTSSTSGNFNSGSHQMGQYSHGGGTEQVVDWRHFYNSGTTGTGGTARALQVGDQFRISLSATTTYGEMGFALLASPSSESSWADRQNNDQISFNLDAYGTWYVKCSNGTADAYTSTGTYGMTGSTSYSNWTFTLTLTAPNRMNATISNGTNTSYFYDLLLNSSNPITDYSVYLNGDYNGSSNQNIYWGLYSGSDVDYVQNTGTIPIGSSNNSYTISGALSNGLDANSTSSNSLNNTLTKSGTGTITLSSASNAYAGGSTINGGTLSVSSDNNLGTAPGSPTAASITLGGGTLGITTGFTLNSNRGITATTSTSSYIDVASGQTLTYGGVLAGSGTISKTSAGKLTLTGGSTFGGLTVSAGTVLLNGSANTQMLGNVTVNSSATLSLGAANQFGTTSTPPFLSINGTLDATNAGAGSYNQNISLQGNSTGSITMGSGILTISNTGSGDNYQGTITGTGGLIKTNTGTEILSGANTSLSGGINVYNGTLKAGNANAINTTNILTLGNSSNSGTFSLNGYNITVVGLTTSGSGSSNTVNNGVSGTNTLTLNTSSNNTYSGVLANGSSGTLAFTNSGSGTITLSGTNTYTGVTTISAGTLQLGATNAIPSGASGVQSAVTLNGGTISTGASSAGFSCGTSTYPIGVLTIGSSNGTIALAGSSSSQTLYFANSSGASWTGTLNITGWTGSAGATGTNGHIYMLGTSAGGLTSGQLASINFGGSYATGAQLISTGNSAYYELVPPAVPVISTIAASPGTTTGVSSGTVNAYNGSTVTITGSNLSSVNAITMSTGGTVNTTTYNGTYNSGPGTYTFTLPVGFSGTVTLANTNGTGAASTPTISNLGYITTSGGNGSWNSSGNWLGGNVPASSSSTLVTIANSITLNTSVTVLNLTVSSGTFTTDVSSDNTSANTLTIATGGTITNNGTITAESHGYGNVAFAGNATLTSGTAPSTVINLNYFTVATGSTISVATNVASAQNFSMGSGSTYSFSFTNNATFTVAGISSSGSNTLNILNGGSSSSSSFITSAPLTIGNGTSLSLGASALPLQATNVTLTGTGALTLGSNVGGDIYVSGNWSYGTGGVFTPNSRAVHFNGTSSSTYQTISATSGTNNFAYLALANTGKGVQLSNNVTLTNNLQIFNGTLDLNQQTITLTNSNLELGDGVSTTTESIISSGGKGYISIPTGISVTATKYNAAGSPSLTVGTNAVFDVTGSFDPGTSLCTFGNGSFVRLNNGYTLPNALAYSNGSTLIYYTGAAIATPQVLGANSWPVSGPSNVILDNNTGFELTADRSINGSFTIASGASMRGGNNTLTLTGGNSTTPTTFTASGTMYGEYSGAYLNLVFAGYTNLAGGYLDAHTYTVSTGDTLNCGNIGLNSNNTGGSVVINGTLITSNTNGLYDGTTNNATIHYANSMPSPTINSASSIIYNASTAQTISPLTYYNLVDSAAGAKTLGGSSTVTNILRFASGSGTLSPSSYTLSITNPLNTAISGGNSSSYINGPVTWTLGTSSTGTYTVPVGASSNYYPLAFAVATSGITSGSPTITVTPNATGAGSADASTLYSTSGAEYWQIVTTGSTFATTSFSLGRSTPALSNLNAIGKNTSNSGYVSIGGTVGTLSAQPSVNTSSSGYSGAGTIYLALAETQVTVTYNGNGSTGGTVPGSTNYGYNTTATAANNTGSLVKSGYTFAGWNTAADGSGTAYAVAATFTITANVTLYAQWTGIAGYWVGTTSTNFSTSSNWANNSTPTTGASITILAGTTYAPVLTSSISLGGITINSGATFGLGGQTLTITGAITSSATATITGSSSSNLTVAGTVGTIYFTSGSAALNNLTVNSGSVVLGNAVTMSGTTTVAGGTLEIGVSISQTFPAFSISSGVIKGDAFSTTTFSGTYTGTGGTVNNSGTITLTGTMASFPGSGVAVNNGLSYSLYNLTVAIGSGNSFNLSTSGPSVNVVGTLTLTSGLINTTGSNYLSVTGSISGGSSTSYVNGPLGIYAPNTSTYTFPIGKGGNYRPVQFAYTSSNASNGVIIEQIEGTISGLPSSVSTARFGARYYTITQYQSGYAYKIGLNNSGGTPTGTPVIIRSDNGTVSSITSLSFSSPYYTTSSAYTATNYALNVVGLVETAIPLTVSGATTSNKVYDGTNTASVTGGSLVGVVSPDAVSLTQAGTFASSTPGTSIAITSGCSISGANSAAYYLIQPTLTARDITAGTAGTWIGVTSTSFSTASNWQNDAAPISTDNITITTGTTYLPVLSGSTTINNLSIASGTTLGLNGNTLTINGAVSGSGTITSSATSSIVIGGTAGTLNFTSGSNTIQNLTLNSSSSATLGNQLNVTAGSSAGIVTVGSGATLTTGGYLVLKSDVNGTARIAQSAGTISGNVTVERYIPAKAARKYSFVASAVGGVSVSSSWQNQIYITGPGTGGTVCGSVNSNGFDETQTNFPAMYTYAAASSGGSHWATIPNTTSTNLSPGTGYKVNIRGNRNSGTVTCLNQLATASPTAPEAVTLSATGSVGQGTVSVNLNTNTTSSNLYTLLGNPYPCPISFSAFQGDNSSNITPNLWLYSTNTTTSGGFAPSNYTTVNGSTVVNAPSGYTASGLNNIESGQSFFVQSATSSAPSVSFAESHKTTGTPVNINFFGTNVTKQIRVGLQTTESNQLDEVVVRFMGNGSNGYNSYYDAISFDAGSQVLVALKGKTKLAISTLPDADAANAASLGVSSSSIGTFQLVFSQFDGIDASKSITLVDNYLKTTQDIRASQAYIFNVTSDTGSYGNNRFELLFGAGSNPLPVSFTSVSATKNNTGVAVNWNVANQLNIANYEVERSTDGSTFASIANEKATAKTAYSVEDANIPTTASTLYYRIKSIGEDGSYKYSTIAKLIIHNSSLITIYPNPVQSVINVTTGSSTNGTYAVRILTVAGKEVMSRRGVSANGNTLSLNASSLAAGVYMLELTDATGNKQTEKFVKD